MAAPTPQDPTLTQIDELVRKKFYSEEVLTRIGWSQRVAEAKAELAHGRSPEDRTNALRKLVASLKTSHTEYIPRSDPRYWEFASIFEEILVAVPALCPQRDQTFPALPVTWQDIGVAWKRVGNQWFAARVFEDGPAKKAGLLAGDEVMTADDKPFNPVDAFAGKQGVQVRLRYRRQRGGAPAEAIVIPRSIQPQAAAREALASSARIIESGGKRIAYVHVWSWTGDAMQEAVKNAIRKLNDQNPTGYIVDLRDGWGGAAPDYLEIFQKEAPVFEVKNRAGEISRVNARIRVPAVVLVNAGSRSGKEAIAYAIKKHHMAKLVGETTAGAVLAGSPHCLPDGALLYVASGWSTVDGEVLEGKGVVPDIEVPFDIRYAAGHDPQLEAAIAALRTSR